MYAYAHVHGVHISFVYNLDIKLKPKLYTQHDLLWWFYSTYVRIMQYRVPSAKAIIYSIVCKMWQLNLLSCSYTNVVDLFKRDSNINASANEVSPSFLMSFGLH